jgi:hypothetical protein
METEEHDFPLCIQLFTSCKERIIVKLIEITSSGPEGSNLVNQKIHCSVCNPCIHK